MVGLLLCIFFYYHEVFSTKKFTNVSRAIVKKTAEKTRHNPDLDKNTTESPPTPFVLLQLQVVPVRFRRHW
jgi:hypothetical protein